MAQCLFSKNGMTEKKKQDKNSRSFSVCISTNSSMVSPWYADSLGVGRVHHAKYELNDCAVKLQASAELVLIQKAHVSARFGSHQFLTGQSHMISITSQEIRSLA